MEFRLNSYYPEDLVKQDERTLRQEYTRLRDIGRKRLQRLRGSEFAESETARYWGTEIPKLKDLQNKNDIVFALSELQGFLSSPYSTLKGAREETKKKVERLKKDPKLKAVLDTLERRYDLKMSPAVANKFFEFMNTELAEKVGKIYGSNRVLELFKVLHDKGIRNYMQYQRTAQDFIFFLENVENLEAVNLPKGSRKSVESYKELIDTEIYHGRDRSAFIKTAKPVRTRAHRYKRK